VIAMEKKRLIDGYTIADDGRAITCKRCGKTSHNLNDARNRYCGQCKLFHEDEKAPLIACVLYIFQPGTAEADIHNSRLPAKPSSREIGALMLPLLDGAGYPRARPRALQGRAGRQGVRDVEMLPHSAGTAVVTRRRIWF
jgi:hypothetical protein